VKVIRVLEKDPKCQALLKHQVYQLRNSKQSSKIGKCIEAKSQFSGDEFYIGQWLFDIKEIEASKCSQNN
jgi:hypothetical protein